MAKRRTGLGEKLAGSAALTRSNFDSGLAALLAALGLPREQVPPGVADGFYHYAATLDRWNRTHNLTSSHGAARRLEVLFADALILARGAWLPQGGRFLDVGAGAGAPSIPLLLLRDDLSGTLLEPSLKRVAFLRTVIGQTENLLSRAAVAATVEGSPEALRLGPQDVAYSRATFAPDAWRAMGSRYANRVLVFYASATAPADAAAAISYTLPSGAPRMLAAFDGDRASPMTPREAP